MINLKRNLLTLALASTGFCWIAASSAAETAQSADATVAADTDASADADADAAKAKAKAKPEATTELEQIVVTGFRGSIESAIATKRDNSSIVESVSAEDIGKLPDVSIGEALARLPGLAAQRIDGRAQSISIRGLGPDFSTALLNGREQVSSGDNRGVEFDQYPAELLSSVVVYKTPDATLIGQGLAGTVDLRTIRPLDYRERILAVNGRYEANGKSALNPDQANDGYRASATYVNQFADDTVGVTFGIASQSTPTQSERFNSWGFADGPDGNKIIGGSKSFAQSNDLDRLGLIGTLEYRPSDSFHTTLDLSYSDFQESQSLRGIELPLQWSSAQLQPGFTADNGLITQGVFNNVKGVMRNDFNERNAKLFTFGWNMRFDFADQWGAETDLSYSRAKRDDFLLESYAGTGPNGQGATDSLGFSVQPNDTVRFSPTLDYTNLNIISLTSPQGWGANSTQSAQEGFLNRPKTEDQLAHLRFSVDRAFSSGAFSKATFGIDVSRRDKDKVANEFFIQLPGDADSVAIPSEALLGTVSLSFLGIPGQIAYNPLFLLDNGFYDQVRNINADVKTKSWKVREDIGVAYVKVDVNTDIGGVALSGNFGLQAVVTNQDSGGFGIRSGGTTAGDGFVAVNEGANYTRLLPSVNLAFDFGNDQMVRFGASRTAARARMDKLSASQSFNTNDANLLNTDPNHSFFSANGGNPKLKPTMATTFDLSFEKYFSGTQGYVALAGFYKDLEDFVNENDSVVFDFVDFVDLLSPAQQQDLGTTLGLVSGPTNRGDGSIKGAELTVSVPLDLIAAPLEGFGIITSGSYTDSSVKLGDNPDPITVPGLSKWVANSTIYFEKNGFQTRLSHRYRSTFLGEVFGFGAGRTLRSVKPENLLDAQISYAFQSGSLEGLTLLGQVSNITNQPFTTFDNGNQRHVIDHQEFGTTFLIGASYKF